VAAEVRPRKRSHKAGGCGEEGDSSWSWIFGAAEGRDKDAEDRLVIKAWKTHDVPGNWG
jgi:hypothetical protein